MDFLRANGIDDPGLQLRDMDYQDVLNQQEIFGQELMLFSNKQMQKEVIVPKARQEPLGVVIVESGWGSMVPTVVLANMNPTGSAARCGQLNIGDQIISVNGVSCVGLPLAQCQTLLKNCRPQTAVKLTIVSCPPVVEVLIKRPDVKYQLGFSVQNGVICSLLRGGIAERGGVRVGHRIIEINSRSVVAVPHERIVNMLATGIGEVSSCYSCCCCCCCSQFSLVLTQLQIIHQNSTQQHSILQHARYNYIMYLIPHIERLNSHVSVNLKFKLVGAHENKSVITLKIEHLIAGQRSIFFKPHEKTIGYKCLKLNIPHYCYYQKCIF